MALIKTGDDLRHFVALRRQRDADRTTVDARALVVDEAEIDQLLQIVGDVRAEIVATRTQLAGCLLYTSDAADE